MHSNSADPVKGYEVPGQRSADSANVDEAGRGTVAEVREGQIGKVDDKQELSEPEVRAYPEVDKSE